MTRPKSGPPLLVVSAMACCRQPSLRSMLSCALNQTSASRNDPGRTCCMLMNSRSKRRTVITLVLVASIIAVLLWIASYHPSEFRGGLEIHDSGLFSILAIVQFWVACRFFNQENTVLRFADFRLGRLTSHCNLMISKKRSDRWLRLCPLPLQYRCTTIQARQFAAREEASLIMQPRATAKGSGC